MCENQGTIWQGHKTVFQAALDDPGDVRCWYETRLEDGTVIYVEEDITWR